MENVRRRIDADAAYRQGLFGQNIGIAILDSGIYPHIDFIGGKNRIFAFKDMIDYQISPCDPNGHGTHIAGILAGSGAASGGRYMGVAPLAHLIILRVLDEKGNGTVDHVCQAVEWVVQNKEKYQIQIMNISVGARIRKNGTENIALVDAVEYAWDQGLIVVAAAGNNGPDAYSVTAPGISRKVITVGAAPEMNEDTTIEQKSSDCLFSGRGPTTECICKPDIIAPGFHICSCSSHPGNHYAFRSGTSMATPVVSGGIALLLCKYPDMDNKSVKSCLRKSALSLKLPKSYQGWGMFNLTKALDGRCRH